MEQLAENYQLKWHSYTTFIHSSVASSLFNENFADVALYTTDGRYVMAHRLVLSSCSQYFNQLLKMAPKLPTSLPFVIVLPSEISYKTLKILLQYMYSGESTVSKEILNQVLRGGDILKIMGLWRPKEDESPKKNGKERTNTPDLNSNSSCDKKSNIENETPDNKNGKIEKPKFELMEQAAIKRQKNVRPEKTSSVIVVNKDRKRIDAKSGDTKGNSSPSSSDEPNQYLVIKEEPIEWTEVSESEMEVINSKDVFNSEIIIKPEILVDESNETDNLYTPLTCELCSETFTVPAEWVRHVQTHTDMLPAKRQRRGRPAPDEENAPFPPLHCDMCQQYFPTPAEWVHHIQNSHTEFELHWANLEKSGTEPQPKSAKHNKQYGPIQKYCSICAKKFPSHASMLIHKRTHTGERPYMCEYCMKGFNVKSNLLRHLRTLHDKIMHPTEVEGCSKEDEN